MTDFDSMDPDEAIDKAIDTLLKMLEASDPIDVKRAVREALQLLKNPAARDRLSELVVSAIQPSDEKWYESN